MTADIHEKASREVKSRIYGRALASIEEFQRKTAANDIAKKMEEDAQRLLDIGHAGRLRALSFSFQKLAKRAGA